MLVSRPQGEQGEDGKAEGPPGPPGDRVRPPPILWTTARVEPQAPAVWGAGASGVGGAAASSAEGMAQEARVWHPLQSSVVLSFRAPWVIKEIVGNQGTLDTL